MLQVERDSCDFRQFTLPGYCTNADQKLIHAATVALG